MFDMDFFPRYLHEDVYILRACSVTVCIYMEIQVRQTMEALLSNLKSANAHMEEKLGVSRYRNVHRQYMYVGLADLPVTFDLPMSCMV